MVRRQAVHELALRIAGALHQLGVYLIRHEHVNALFPNGIRFTHGHPNVSIEEVAALHAGIHVVGDGDAGAGFLGHFPALFHQPICRLEGLRGHNPHVHAHLGSAHQQGVPHVEAGIAQVGETHLVQGLVAVLFHGEEIGQNLRGMGLIGKAVPHGHAGILGQVLHSGLGKAAVLDAVVHAPEHARGILHGFLNADLAAGRAQVSDMGALVIGGHLKSTTRSG